MRRKKTQTDFEKDLPTGEEPQDELESLKPKGPAPKPITAGDNKITRELDNLRASMHKQKTKK